MKPQELPLAALVNTEEVEGSQVIHLLNQVAVLQDQEGRPLMDEASKSHRRSKFQPDS